MVAMNLVETKNTHTESKHRADLLRVSTANRGVNSSQARVEKLQQAFWNAVSHLSREMQRSKDMPPGAVHGAVSNSLASTDRSQALFGGLNSIKVEMAKAHRELYHAKRSLEGAVSVASRSGNELRGLQCLITSMKRKVNCRTEARIQDEISDSVGARRGMGSRVFPAGIVGIHLRRIEQPTVAISPPVSHQPVNVAPADCDDKSRSTTSEANSVIPGEARSSGAMAEGDFGVRMCTAPSASTATRGSYNAVDSGISRTQGATSSIIAGAQLSEILHTVEGENHSLSMSCQLAGGSVVALRVSGAREGPIRVAVSVPTPERHSAANSVSVGTIGRHTATLIERLRASGLNVDTIEVSSATSTVGDFKSEKLGQGAMSRRRRTFDGVFDE